MKKKKTIMGLKMEKRKNDGFEDGEKEKAEEK